MRWASGPWSYPSRTRRWRSCGERTRGDGPMFSQTCAAAADEREVCTAWHDAGDDGAIALGLDAEEPWSQPTPRRGSSRRAC